ncbi:MAG: hypothetical protein HRU41_07125 [Saprospiraceae bacterium]|nr:hypothetical protein [Saprospiraceae bacterium]
MRPSAPTSYQRIIKRLKLEDEFSLTTKMDKTSFLSLLQDNIDEDTGPQLFESLKPRLKPYKGFITPSGFKLKRRKRAFESNNDMARITGTLKSDLRHTEIVTHIGYPEFTIKAISGLMLLVYTVILGVVLTVDLGDTPVWMPFLIVGHFFLIFGILFFVLRYQIKTSTRKVRRFLVELLEQSPTETGDAETEPAPFEQLELKQKKRLFRR